MFVALRQVLIVRLIYFIFETNLKLYSLDEIWLQTAKNPANSTENMSLVHHDRASDRWTATNAAGP